MQDRQLILITANSNYHTPQDLHVQCIYTWVNLMGFLKIPSGSKVHLPGFYQVAFLKLKNIVLKNLVPLGGSRLGFLICYILQVNPFSN